jgi:hypothetical protein
LFQNYTPQAGGAFYDSNKKIIGGWESDPTATNTEFDIPSNAAYIRFNVSKAQYANGTAWLRLGTLDAPNVLQGQTVHPIYKDDLAKEYELETNQRFYRAKLSGKITFVRDDYDYINRQSFDNEFLYCIEKSDDGGRTWFQYFQGKFMKTNRTPIITVIINYIIGGQWICIKVVDFLHVAQIPGIYIITFHIGVHCSGCPGTLNGG